MHYPLTSNRYSASTLITAKELANNGSFTTLQARRSLHERFCDKALVIAQQDWKAHIGDNRAYLFPATENKTSGNWIALVMPDAIPFRLGLMMYAANMVMLHADIASDQDSENNLNKLFAGDLEAPLPTFSRVQNSTPTSAFHSTLHPSATALLAGDRAFGTEVLLAWRAHYPTLPRLPTPSDVPNLGTFLNHRVAALGTEAWLVTLRHALGISLTPAELGFVGPALEVSGRGAALTMDYYAWGKQSRSHDNNTRQDNLVAFAMALLEDSETVEDGSLEVSALGHVKTLAIGAEQQFQRCKAAVDSRQGSEVQVFLDAVEAFVADNGL